MYRALIVDDEPLMRQYLVERLQDIHPGLEGGGLGRRRAGSA